MNSGVCLRSREYGVIVTEAPDLFSKDTVTGIDAYIGGDSTKAGGSAGCIRSCPAHIAVGKEDIVPDTDERIGAVREDDLKLPPQPES